MANRYFSTIIDAYHSTIIWYNRNIDVFKRRLYIMTRFHKQTYLNVLKLSLPAVGEMLLYTLIWVFDTMMVGRYGGNIAVSSVGLCTEILSTFSNILIASGISVGITSLIARYTGAKNIAKAEECATIGYGITIIISLIVSILFAVFALPLLKTIGADDNVALIGSSYMRIACIGIFFSMMTTALSATLRGSGNTVTPLIIAASVNIINIFLDYCLIFGRFSLPELGTDGAAIATAIAEAVGFSVASVYFIKYSKIKIRIKYIKSLNIFRTKSLINLSVPAMLQEASFSISRLICNLFIVSLGTIAFAANQITTTIESLSYMPGWGFAVAATTLVGQKVGEKNYKGAKEYASVSLILGILTMSICSVLFLVIPGKLINLFITSNESEVIKFGTYCLMVAAIEQPFTALSMIAGGILKGTGDTKTPFKVALFTSWAIRLPLMFIAIFVLKMSVVSVWVITSIQWVIDGTLLYILFKKNFKRNYNL